MSSSIVLYRRIPSKVSGRKSTRQRVKIFPCYYCINCTAFWSSEAGMDRASFDDKRLLFKTCLLNVTLPSVHCRSAWWTEKWRHAGLWLECFLKKYLTFSPSYAVVKMKSVRHFVKCYFFWSRSNDKYWISSIVFRSVSHDLKFNLQKISETTSNWWFSLRRYR